VPFLEKLISFNYSSLLLIWLGSVFGYAILYYILGRYGDGAHGPTFVRGVEMQLEFGDILYYSIITATSTGYGDIIPQGASKLFASTQSIFALLVFAICVTKLVSHRQDLALIRVHRLAFENIFHNIREGLYIVRQDFGNIMRHIENGEQMTEEGWKNLIIAFEQSQSLIQEIPDFYDNENKLYIIDRRRERLLKESVHRTLSRVNDLLDVMSSHDIDWAGNEGTYNELSELLRIVDETTPIWLEKSPHSEPEAFEDILHLKDAVLQRINTAVPGSN